MPSARLALFITSRWHDSLCGMDGGLWTKNHSSPHLQTKIIYMPLCKCSELAPQTFFLWDSMVTVADTLHLVVQIFEVLSLSSSMVMVCASLNTINNRNYACSIIYLLFIKTRNMYAWYFWLLVGSLTAFVNSIWGIV